MDGKTTYVNEQQVDSLLAAQLAQVLPVISANASTLGISAAQVTALTNLINTFTTQYNASQSARASWKAAVTTKDVAKKAVRDQVTIYAKQWRANPSVPDALLDQLQMAPHKPVGTTSAPVTPTNFQAAIDGLGNVTLTWKSNGNKPGTVYVVESRDSATGDWSIYGVETRTRMTLEAEAGKYIAFRVSAQRNKNKSTPTIPIVLWEGGSSEFQPLRVAA
jgi:hypothetical protein